MLVSLARPFIFKASLCGSHTFKQNCTGLSSSSSSSSSNSSNSGSVEPSHPVGPSLLTTRLLRPSPLLLKQLRILTSKNEAARTQRDGSKPGVVPMRTLVTLQNGY
jgi:hypothetical protein